MLEAVQHYYCLNIEIGRADGEILALISCHKYDAERLRLDMQVKHFLFLFGITIDDVVEQ